MKIFPVPILTDNYVWIVARNGRALVVDPGQDAPVQQALTQHQLHLDAILLTHRHWDHVNGVPGLVHANGCDVYGPDCKDMPGVTHTVTEGDILNFADVASFSVWHTPGHTSEHLSYIMNDAPGGLFCGDTLFSGGCGRLLGGTAEQLHQSLNRLATLPAHTPVYCTHEYTQANLRFASAVDENNEALAIRSQEVQALRNQNAPTLPSSIGAELTFNPFLRCDQPQVRNAVNTHDQRVYNDSQTVFTQLRQWKDGF